MVCLSRAGDLVATLCGWAIDHEIGKAALEAGYFFPGRMVSTVPDDAREEWERRSAIANSHEPEKEGARISGFSADKSEQHREFAPEVQREMIVNILRRLNAGLDLSLLKDLMAALEALNLGETLPLFEPSKPMARAGDYTRAKLQLDTLCWIEYHAHRSHEDKAAPAIRRVLKALGREPTEEAVRGIREWHGRVVKKLGIIHVEQMLGFARNSASYPLAYEAEQHIGDTFWSEDEWGTQVERIEAEFSTRSLMRICEQLKPLL